MWKRQVGSNAVGCSIRADAVIDNSQGSHMYNGIPVEMGMYKPLHGNGLGLGNYISGVWRNGNIVVPGISRLMIFYNIVYTLKWVAW